MVVKIKTSGGAKLMASGKKPVLLPFTPNEHAALKRAAESCRQSMTQFCIFHVMKAVEDVTSQIAIKVLSDHFKEKPKCRERKSKSMPK